jgi:hypothetical protein
MDRLKALSRTGRINVPFTDHFSEVQKKIMLQNAVLGIDELRHVENTADLLSTSSGNPLGYDEYCSLLLAGAVSQDEQYKPKKSSHNNDDIQSENEDQYEIDYPASSLQAFATSFCNRPPMQSNAPKSRMSAEKWHSLDDKSKATWDRLGEKVKSIILG